MKQPDNPTEEDAPWWHDLPELERRALGIVFHNNGREWAVHRTLSSSPAEIAGVRSGDVIDSVSEKRVQGTLRHTKLTSLIDLLDDDAEHEIVFVRGQERVPIMMRPRVLRELIEADVAKRGPKAKYCYSCPSCYSRPSGVRSCSECPGFNCTVG